MTNFLLPFIGKSSNLIFKMEPFAMLTAELTEKELKSQLIKELDKLDRERLLIVLQFTSRLIAEELIDSVTHDWEMGKINRAAIKKAVDEHRARNPYETMKP
jgi:hypothetical protein